MTRLKFFATLLLSMLAMVACSPADNSDQATEAPATENPAAEAPAAEMPGTAEQGGVSEAILAALASPARPQAARTRDAGRKPGEVLSFFGVAPGMRVLEIGAGGGYYTEILNGVVGPEGRVLAQNSPGKFYETRLKGVFEPLVARLANTEALIAQATDIDLAENSLDAALIILIYHHMHYNKDQGEVLPDYTKKALANIRKALKPGGVLGIVEHAAPDGTSRADSAPLHRVDVATTRADITGEGFVLAGESDVLHVADDDRSVYWRGTPHQGKTWRLVQKFVKPASE